MKIIKTKKQEVVTEIFLKGEGNQEMEGARRREREWEKESRCGMYMCQHHTRDINNMFLTMY